MILIVYIGTGKYIERFPTFWGSVDKFCPGTIKLVNVVGPYHGTYCDTDYLRYKWFRDLHHSNWPIVALEKFRHILDCIDHQNPDLKITHVFYFNSNIKFIRKVYEPIFLTDDIITVHNVGWDHLGHNPENFTFGPLKRWISERRKIESACWIDNPWYDYCQSCLFGGPIDLMKQLCTECDQYLAHDLANNFIPVFHDETAFNKWIYEHKDKVTILSNDYCMDEEHAAEWGHPNPNIVLTNSDDTQYNYKDKFMI